MKKYILALVLILGLTIQGFPADVCTTIPAGKIPIATLAMDWKFGDERGAMTDLDFAKYLQREKFWKPLITNYNEAIERDQASIDAVTKTTTDVTGID